MHATRAGSTFSIFSTFHIDASALSSCFDRHTGLSEFVLSLVNFAQLSPWARTANTHHFIKCLLLRICHFFNHAPHSSRKHIFDFQHFSYRCKCPQFMFCSQRRPLNSCFDRHMGLSEFALSLVTCAQLSSRARNANTHGNIGCAFYASTAAQNTPEQIKEA